MSYSIYYDRAFVRVGDKFIPLANSGSNNCFEFRGNREVPEKNWGVLNRKHAGQVMFTDAEIRELARQYDQCSQESGMIYKSRNMAFGPGEFERWIINGMKNTYTIEEYHSFGNRFYVLDYSPEDIGKWVKHPFSTVEELLDILDRLGTKREISIKLENNREVRRPVKRRTRGHSLKPGDLSEYYILAGTGTNLKNNSVTMYFVKLTRYGLKYVFSRTSSAVRPFRTEAEAARYIKKYKERLSLFAAFKPELICARPVLYQEGEASV